MNTNTNPTVASSDAIDLFIVSLLLLVEGISWIINELTGGHEIPPKALPSIQPLFTDLHSLTVKQLQALVGTKNSRYRKADLIQLALAY